MTCPQNVRQQCSQRLGVLQIPLEVDLPCSTLLPCRHESAEAVVAAMQGGHSGATVDSVTQLVEELSRLH